MSLLVWILASALLLLVLGDVLELRATRLRPNRTVRAPIRSSVLFRPITLSENAWWFIGAASLYLLVAVYLVLVRGDVVGDAESRVAQAWYVVASRDPHLGAIGFIWNPLPSIAEIPLVMLRGIWPALTQRAFAASIVSSLCMAGAVTQFRSATAEMGARRSVAIVLTACFALDPMTIYYGANGMSEAMYLLFLVGTTRYLLAWTVKGNLPSLVAAAVSLALAYLTRYEAFAAAIAVALVVFVVGTNARSHRVPRRERMNSAGSDVVMVVFPFAMAFLGWMAASWLITGQPFEQFTSRYGNSSLIGVAGATVGANGTNWPRIALAMVQIMSYAPLLLVLGIVVTVVAVRRRDRRLLALAALAGPLLFSTTAYVLGLLAGWNLRFYIPTLPLYLLAVALVLSPLPGMLPATPRWLTRAPATVATVVLLLGVPGLVTVGLAMDNTHIGPTEQASLSWLFHPPRTVAEVQSQSFLPSAQFIADEVDKLGLGNGSVAVDTFGCGSLIVMNSNYPQQFIVTSDRDFEEVAADPLAFGVPYVLVPDSDQSINAISVAHPGIFQGGRDGDLVTRVVAQYVTKGCATYRLLRVVSDSA